MIKVVQFTERIVLIKIKQEENKMYIDNGSLIIAGAILVVGIAIAYLWFWTRDKKKRR